MRGWQLITLAMPILFATIYQYRAALSRAWPCSALLSRLSWSPVRAMSTTTFQHPQYNIPISLPPGLSKDQVLSFHPFNVRIPSAKKKLQCSYNALSPANCSRQSWLSTLQASLSAQHAHPAHPFHADPYALRSVTVQAYDLFGGGRLGFLKLTSRVANAAGESLPGAVFLRGPSVAVLVMLVPEDGGGGGGGDAAEGKEEEERYVLLTVQPRVAAGSLAFVELPAGMVDEAGNFSGAAAREMYEELGMEIAQDQLVSLSELAAGGHGKAEAAAEDASAVVELPSAVYPSPGGCDEYIPIYMHERRVPRAQLGEWAGKLTGLREHGEKITLKLVRMKDLWKEGARDAKCLAAVALWEGLRREGKV